MSEMPRTGADEPISELEMLRRDNAMLRETLDAVEGSVVVYDRDRRYLFGNAAYHALFPHLPPDGVLRGEHYGDVLARSIEAGIVPDAQAYADRAAFIARRLAELGLSEAEPREAFNERPGREELFTRVGRWFLVRARRTATENRVTLRVDITAQKKLQEELAAAREAAEAASRVKSQFLANVTHELRTPLNAVINFAELLAEEIHGPLGAPAYAEYAREIQGSGRQLLGLIEQLLDLARAEAGRLSLTESVIDPASLVRQAAAAMTPAAEGRRLALVVVLPEGLPPMRADAARLRQMLLNLIDNAIRYNAPGGFVRIAAETGPDGLAITIADSGDGIPAADLERVMQPFEKARSQTPGGLGIGLPLARHLLALHGGTLELANQAGAGTTVTLRFPTFRLMRR
jgi:signal transduction histidine kinase